MTNEEKAKEISDIYMPDTGFTRDDLYDAAMEMAQFILSNQWISVEEVLPDYEEDVLVTNDVGDYWFSHRTKNNNVMQDKNNFASVDSIFNITHWMPIPSLEGGEE